MIEVTEVAFVSCLQFISVLAAGTLERQWIQESTFCENVPLLTLQYWYCKLMFPSRTLSINGAFRVWHAVPRKSIAAVVVGFFGKPRTHQSMVNFTLSIMLSVLQFSLHCGLSSFDDSVAYAKTSIHHSLLWQDRNDH